MLRIHHQQDTSRKWSSSLGDAYWIFRFGGRVTPAAPGSISEKLKTKLTSSAASRGRKGGSHFQQPFKVWKPSYGSFECISCIWKIQGKYVYAYIYTIYIYRHIYLHIYRQKLVIIQLGDGRTKWTSSPSFFPGNFEHEVCLNTPPSSDTNQRWGCSCCSCLCYC